jgi:glycosyltransferase involved in cell wall biosynthesis
MQGNKKRICMLADSHGLYDDRIYWKEAVSLMRGGYEVHFVLAADRNEHGITSEGIRYTKLKHVTYSRNRYINYLFKLLIPGGIYSRMFMAAATIKADVYHIHDLRVNHIGARLKKLPWKPKVIYDVHEPYPENIIDYNETKGIATFVKEMYAESIRKWENKCAQKYDLILATEENVQARFREFIPEEKVQIIYNYTDLEKGKPLSFDDKEYDAIYCGGITKRRGAMKILGAVRLVKEGLPGLKVLFLGTYFPPELKLEMLEFVRQNSLEKNVILLDNVPYTEVGEYYRKSKLGLGIFLPIRTHKIILQIKIFEYMNFGLPIIGSNFGHISRYITEYKAGITVNPESEAEIAYAMTSLLKNKSLYDEMCRNGLKASENFQWKFMEEKLLTIYHQITAN